MRPEMPYLAAGGIVLAGGAIKAKGVPPNAVRSLIGTVVLTIVASATAGGKLAPMVHAFGILLVIGALLAATNNVIKKG